MNIKKGLNRLAILICVSISFLGVAFSILSNWEEYQHSLSMLNSVRYVINPDESSIDGWSFDGLRYQKAIAEGYTDSEIVLSLSSKFNDFDLEIHKKKAAHAKRVKLLSAIAKCLSYSMLFFVVSYVVLLLAYFIIRWIYRGFKPPKCGPPSLENAL